MRMAELRNSAISRAEKLLSRSIEYESLGPSFFGTIDLRGLRIFSDRDEPLAQISRLRISYSLFDILKGEPLSALREVRIDKTIIIFDEKRDADILALFKRSDSASSLSMVPEGSLKIHVRDSSFTWKGIDSDLSVRGLFVEASLNNQRLSLDTRSSLSFRLPQFGGKLGQTELTFRSSGVIALDESTGKLRVQVPSIRNALGQVSSLNFQAFLQKDSLEVRKVQDRISLDFFARLDRRSGNWNAELITEAFSPRKILMLEGPLASLDPWLSTSLTGSASFSYTKSRQLTYLFNLSGLFASNVPLPRASFRLVGSGDLATLELDNASLVSSRGNLDFTGTVNYAPLIINGDLDIAAVRLPDGSELSVSFNIGTENQNVSLYADTLKVGDLELSAVDIQVSPKDASYDFSVSALRFSDMEAYGEVRLARISSEGVFFTQDPLLQFSVSVDSLATSDLLSLLSPAFKDLRNLKQSWLSNASLTTEVFISTDFISTSFNAPRFVTAYRGDLDAFLFASVSGTNQRISISDGRLIWKDGSATARLNLDFSDPDDMPFSALISFKGNDYSFEGIVLDKRTLSLQGSYGLNANISFSDGVAFSGYLSSQALPLPIGDRSFSLSMNSVFRWQSSRSWNIRLDRFELEDLSGSNPLFIRSSLQALITESGASLSELIIDEGKGLLTGTGESSWDPGFKNVYGKLRLSGEKTERYDIEGSLKDKLVSLRLYTLRAKLLRFLPVSEDSYATGEIRLSFKNLDDFEASWLLSEARLKLKGEEAVLSSSGTMNSRELYIENTRVSYTGYTHDISAFHIDRTEGTLSASLRSKGIAVGRDADLAARAQFSFKSVPSWSEIQSALGSFQGQIDVSTARIAALEAKESFTLLFTKEGEFVSVSGETSRSTAFPNGRRWGILCIRCLTLTTARYSYRCNCKGLY
ncbi:hypothetical protein MASR2M78_15570 [Treponema sp.]